MPSGWSKQAYVKGFYCETITFKKSANMFGYMKYLEKYMKVLQKLLIKTTRADTNLASRSRQNEGKSALSKITTRWVNALASVIKSI